MFAAAAHYTHSLVRKRGNNNNCLLTSPRNDPKAFTFDPKRLERVRSAAARAESERRRKEVEIERRLDREEAAAAGFEKERLSQAIEQATFGGRGNNGAVVMSSQRDMMSLDRPSPGTSQLPLPFRQQQPQPPQQPFISSVLVLINLLPNAEDPEEYEEWEQLMLEKYERQLARAVAEGNSDKAEHLQRLVNQMRESILD